MILREVYHDFQKLRHPLFSTFFITTNNNKK